MAWVLVAVMMVCVVALGIGTGSLMASWCIDAFKRRNLAKSNKKIDYCEDKVAELEEWNRSWHHPELDGDIYWWDGKEFREDYAPKSERTHEKLHKPSRWNYLPATFKGACYFCSSKPQLLDTTNGLPFCGPCAGLESEITPTNWERLEGNSRLSINTGKVQTTPEGDSIWACSWCNRLFPAHEIYTGKYVRKVCPNCKDKGF